MCAFEYLVRNGRLEWVVEAGFLQAFAYDNLGDLLLLGNIYSGVGDIGGFHLQEFTVQRLGQFFVFFQAFSDGIFLPGPGEFTRPGTLALSSMVKRWAASGIVRSKPWPWPLALTRLSCR